MKNKIVYFGDKNAVIYTVESVKPFINNKDVLINPDLSGVDRLPPHHWKRDGYKVIEMTESEKKAVDLWHSKNVQVNPKLLIIPEKIIEVEVPYGDSKETKLYKGLAITSLVLNVVIMILWGLYAR
jgi:hypothetical protein